MVTNNITFSYFYFCQPIVNRVFYIFLTVFCMTKAEFEKLVAKDKHKNEILTRITIGEGILKNDEDWYDICARQYELSNGNSASFFANLYNAIDFYKIEQANF